MEKDHEQAPDPVSKEVLLGDMALDGIGLGRADLGDHSGSAEFDGTDGEGGNPNLPSGPKIPRGRRR
jgi:hypothetical protein